MISRIKVKLMSSATPSLLMEMVILLPLGPRIRLTASMRVISFVNSSSILKIWSPDLIPALNAGVSSMGETTVRMPPLIVISMPRPPKRPWVSIWSSLYRSGVKKALCGSKAWSIPSMAPFTNSLV